jgi:hypothetical protein
MGYSEQEAKEAWKQMRRRTKPETLYCAIIHFHECDVTFTDNTTTGGRKMASLNAQTRHTDAMHGLQVKPSRGFKSPYPNRPYSGANLGDGVLQSFYLWANRASRGAGDGSGGVDGVHLRVVSSSPVGGGEAAAPPPALAPPPAPDAVSPMAVVAPGWEASPATASSPPPAATAQQQERQRLRERRLEAGWRERGNLDPYEVNGAGNFVCSFTAVVTLVETVEQHRVACSGGLSFALRRMSQKRLAGRCVAVCSCGHK